MLTSEVAPPALAVGLVLLLAVFAWAVMIIHARSIAGDMAMGLGSPGAFATGWLLMMAAMMLPTVLPLVFEFVRRSESRAGWHIATGLLITTYLCVWLAFGFGAYLLYHALGMPWTDQDLIGGVSLVFAGFYALSPVKRSSDARCRELCALHGPLPFNLQHSAILIGARYSISCVGSSSALMVAMVLIGMSDVGGMATLSALVLLYKLPLMDNNWLRALLSVALAGFGLCHFSVG